ncbi:MAG TPA: hypothetical protein PK272_05340, partial [Methanoregulaceae archaeon]|nr:hypothetical protein [Methanoregulaceae archaeon]
THDLAGIRGERLLPHLAEAGAHLHLVRRRLLPRVLLHLLVNEAADRFFIGNAQKLKSLEVTESALKTNTKIVLPEGQQIVNVIGELAGSKLGLQE